MSTVLRMSLWYLLGMLVGTMVFLSEVKGQIVAWDFSTLTGGTNNFGPSPYNATSSNANITVVGLTRGSGIGTTGTGAANAWGGNDLTAISQANAISGNDFATFTITANSGYQVSISSIGAYNIRRSGTGSTTGIWQYQIGAGAFTDIGSAITWGSTTTAAGNPQASIDLSGISDLQNVPAGTTITFRIVAWGASAAGGTWYFNDPTDTTTDDLVINGTVNLSTTGTSTLTSGTLTEPAALSSLANTQGTGVNVFDFTFTDDGATPATDALATQISQIIINQNTGNATELNDWTQVIEGAELSDGITSVSGTIAATSITFASLANANPGDFGHIADNGNKTYTLKIWLKTNVGNTIQQVIEGKDLVFEVTNSSFSFNGGSNLATGQSVNSGDGNNAIEVIATKYYFRSVPSNVATSSNFTVVVDATDANNNRDIDNTSAVILAKNTGSGNFTVTSPQNLVAGSRSFTDCQVDADDTYTLNASGAFATITSSNIIATAANTGDYRSRNTTGTWNVATDWERFDGANWVTAATPPSSADGVITILSGHTMTLNSNVTADQIIISANATIHYTSNTLTLANGTGDDLTIFGIFNHDGGNEMAIQTGATVLVKTNGEMRVTSNVGGISDAYAGNGATEFTYETDAIFGWNTNLSFATSGQTYFGNAGIGTSPIFRTSINIASVGGGTPTVFNGIFEANANIAFANGGTKTFRNGIRGTGTITQNATSNRFIINGDNAVLGGNLVLNTNGLQINHAGTTTLNANVSVSGGTISLISGDIDLNGFNLDLGATASIDEDLANNHLILDNTAINELTRGGSILVSNRNVDATPQNIAGTGLQLNDATPYTVSFRRFHYVAGGASIKRVYSITSGTPTATTLRVYYAEDELNGLIEPFVLFSYNTVAGWENKGFTDRDNIANFVELTNVNQFSPWTVGSPLTPLPIQLVRFEAKSISQNQILLTWATASEINNQGFEIQKSANGLSFQTIGFVVSKGESSQLQNYQFIHSDSFFDNTIYYRLKQIDLDGKHMFSPVVSVERPDSEEFTIFPHPIRQSLTEKTRFKLGTKTKRLAFQLTDIQGKLLFQADENNPDEIENLFQKTINRLSKGLYILQLKTDSGFFVRKVLIE